MRSPIHEMLLKRGASAIGFASVGEALDGDISHLERAISIGFRSNLKENTLRKLDKLQKKVAKFLKSKGFRYLCIPPDSDRISDTFVSRLYPLFTHKIAATCAGIGWIGRNGLLISPEYGPRLSLATVLTDAPFVVDEPIKESLCGECNLCVEHCPSKAITGQTWSRENPFPELIKTENCKDHKKNARSVDGRPNCGLCINICPYGRNDNGKKK